MEDIRIERVAFQFYDDALPYHNFNHVREALSKADEFIDQCKRASIAVDEKIVYYALLFHDAAYGENPRNHGFHYKEDFSASIAEIVLLQHDFPQNLVQSVKQAICGTRRGAGVTETSEVKIVRAADLFPIAASYDVFRWNTLKLKREQEQISGVKLTWGEWRNQVIPELESFLEVGFFAPPGKDSTVREFCDQARRNLESFRLDDGA